MAKKEIILTIGNDGSITVEGEHFSGPACDKELRALAEALGVIESVDKKPEFYETEKRVIVNTQKAGG